jgi:hypothetical protein
VNVEVVLVTTVLLLLELVNQASGVQIYLVLLLLVVVVQIYLVLLLLVVVG